MFDNSGKKIKSYAFLCFIISVIIFTILGIVLIRNEMTTVAIIVIVLGIILSYINCLFLSAFGELVECSIDTSETNKQILVKLNSLLEIQRTKSASKESIQETKPRPKTTAASPKTKERENSVAIDNSENIILCPKCKMPQRSNRTRCYNCGTPFEPINQNKTQNEHTE